MLKKIKLVIADDHELIRKGYMSLLEEDTALQVVGEAGNGKDLLEILKKRGEVDIILLDLEMPVMSGDQAFAIITKRFPGVKVIVISMHYSNELVSEFLSRGVCAYLPKNCSPEMLFRAIYAVHESGQYIDHESACAMLYSLKKEKVRFSYSDKESLTPRETEITKLRALGMTYKEIGRTLSITPRAVDYHCQNIYVKINIQSTAELVMYAVRSGILDLGDSFRPAY